MRARLFHDDNSYEDGNTHSSANSSSQDGNPENLICRWLETYRDIYFDANIQFLVSASQANIVQNILEQGSKMRHPQFLAFLQEAYPGNDAQSEKIKAIYSVFHLMMTGQLSRQNRLMGNLRNALPQLSVQEINAIVSKHVTIAFITRNGNYSHSNQVLPNDPTTPTKGYY